MLKQKRGSKGFTLIELLVVITIIAILAAILFPVFIRVRISAQKVACINNLKQIGVAIQLYVKDYDELFPAVRGFASSYLVDQPPDHTTGPGTAEANPLNARVQLWGGANGAAAAVCPDPLSPTGWHFNLVIVNYLQRPVNMTTMTQGGHRYITGPTQLLNIKALSCPGLTPKSYWDVPGTSNFPIRISCTVTGGSMTSGITNPSTAFPHNASVAYIFNSWASMGFPASQAAGNIVVINGQPVSICKVPAQAPIVWDLISGYLEPNLGDAQIAHGDVINVLYVDGHVKSFSMGNKPPWNTNPRPTDGSAHFWGSQFTYVSPDNPGTPVETTAAAAGWF